VSRHRRTVCRNGIFWVALFAFAARPLLGSLDFSLAVRGGSYGPASTTINDGLIAPANTFNRDLSRSLQPLGFQGSITEGPALGRTLVFGGEAEVRILGPVAVSVGIESFKKASTSSVSGDFLLYDGSQGSLEQATTVETSLLHVFGTVKVRLEGKAYSAFLGGGAGLVRAKVSTNISCEESVNGATTVAADPAVMKGECVRVVPHAAAGAEWKLLRWLSLAADVQYVIGTLNRFEVKEDSLDASNIGKTFFYFDAQGNAKELAWELTGISLGAGLRVRF
jgi:hypothetical protein